VAQFVEEAYSFATLPVYTVSRDIFKKRAGYADFAGFIVHVPAF
jgi:hypothetical protein